MKWLASLRSEHPAPERLSEYLDGRLTGRALQRVDAHLKVCAACREELESLRATVALLRRALQPTPRRSLVLMQPPVPAQTSVKPRRPLAPAWAFSATATVLAAVFVTVLSLDVGGRLAPASPVPALSAAPESLKTAAPTSQPDDSTFGIAAVPAPTQAAAPQPMPTPAPDRGLLAGAAEKAPTAPAEKADTSTPAPADASQITASIPPIPTRVLEAEPMAPGRTYSQEPVLTAGSVDGAPAPIAAPEGAPPAAAASPEAAPAQATAQGPTPWAWRLAEGLLAAGALLAASFGLWRWGRARRAAR